MGANTSIEWTDHSWPIVNGCRRASPGCEKCYAERLQATRLSKTPKYRGLAVYKQGKGPRYTGKTRLWEPDLELPLSWKKPAKIFVADMGDLFYEKVSDADIDRIFAVMALAPRHTFQVLTKRAERMREYINGVRGRFEDINEAARKILKRDDIAVLPTQRHGMVAGRWPLLNVWLGVSAENQEWAGKRIPDLLATPAAIRWVSYEPALGPIDFEPWLPRRMALEDIPGWALNDGCSEGFTCLVKNDMGSASGSRLALPRSDG